MNSKSAILQFYVSIISGLQSEERSPYGNLIRDNERSSEKIMKQNLSEQNPYVAGEVTSHEHELMEWEPIEDEKILSHVRLLNVSEAAFWTCKRLI
jgi:hypothetical protein